MKLIEINNRFYNVPETWNELNRQQLLQVMDLLHGKAYPEAKGRLKLLRILAGMSWWAFFRAPLTSCEKFCFSWRNLRLSLGVFLFMCRRPCTGLEEYLYLTEFLLEKNTLTKNLLPEYKGFAGPADEGLNLTMNEFVFLEHLYLQWAEKREDLSLLNQFVAVLYRPVRRRYNKRKNPKGDCREDFNENLSMYYAGTRIYAWPMKVKLAIVHYYEACRQKWVDDNPDVFSGSGGEPAQYGLLSVMRGVAKSGVHGSKLEEVGQKYVNAIMMELNEMVREAREQEKAMKK